MLNKSLFDFLDDVRIGHLLLQVGSFVKVNLFETMKCGSGRWNKI